jgi:hypothetical protein
MATPVSIIHKPGCKCKAGYDCMQTQNRIMQHHAKTHTRPNAQHRSTPQPQCSRILTALPGIFSAQSTRAQQTLQDKPANQLARSKTAQSPLPEHIHESHTHANTRIALIQPAPADRRHRAKWRRTWVKPGSLPTHYLHVPV